MEVRNRTVINVSEKCWKLTSRFMLSLSFPLLTACKLFKEKKGLKSNPHSELPVQWNSTIFTICVCKGVEGEEELRFCVHKISIL
jgi:hypothetical protein